MRKSFLAAVAFGTATSIWMSATPVLARDYPFCIKGTGYESSVGDCSFDTYQQCQASASGRGDYCDSNPFFSPPTGPSSAHSRRQPRVR